MNESQKLTVIKIIGLIMFIVGFYIFTTYGGSTGLLNPIYALGALSSLLGAFLVLFYGRTKSRDQEDQKF